MTNNKSMLLQAFLLLFSLEVGVAERSLRGGQNEWSVNATKMNIVDTLDERKLIIGGSVARSGEYPYFGMLFSFHLPFFLVFPMTNVLRLVVGISHFLSFYSSSRSCYFSVSSFRRSGMVNGIHVFVTPNRINISISY